MTLKMPLMTFLKQRYKIKITFTPEKLKKL